MLYSPKVVPGLNGIAALVVDQEGHPQPDAQGRHHQHQHKGGRNAAGLQKYIMYGEMYKIRFCNILHKLYCKIP